jgi:hypothetical protein
MTITLTPEQSIDFLKEYGDFPEGSIYKILPDGSVRITPPEGWSGTVCGRLVACANLLEGIPIEVIESAIAVMEKDAFEDNAVSPGILAHLSRFHSTTKANK